VVEFVLVANVAVRFAALDAIQRRLRDVDVFALAPASAGRISIPRRTKIILHDRTRRGRQPLRHFAATFHLPHMTELISANTLLHRAAAAVSRQARQIGPLHSRRGRIQPRANVPRDRRSRREAEGRRRAQGAALTKFLLNVQEYDLAAAKMSRKLRRAASSGPAGVEHLEKKTDFEDKKALEKLLKRHRQSETRSRPEKLPTTKSTSLRSGDSGRAGPARRKELTGRSQPPRSTSACGASAKAVAEVDRPPSTVTRNGDKIVKQKASDVLAYVLEEPKKISRSRDSRAWAK